MIVNEKRHSAGWPAFKLIDTQEQKQRQRQRQQLRETTNFTMGRTSHFASAPKLIFIIISPPERLLSLSAYRWSRARARARRRSEAK